MSSFSCKALIAVSCVLRASVHSGSDDEELRLRHSPDTPLMSHPSYPTPGTITIHSHSGEINGWPPSRWNLPTHPRPNTAHFNLFFKSFGVCVFLLDPVTEVFPFNFLFYLCAMSWKIFLCCICSNKTGILQRSRWSRERARVRTFFFPLTGPTSIQIKSFYLP